MVLMKDIAEAVGVSNATVSLVLGGKSGSRVSESVKNKVLQTAKEWVITAMIWLVAYEQAEPI